MIGAAIDVHRDLGPGMLEHPYELCLDAGLRKRDLRVERATHADPRWLPFLEAIGQARQLAVELRATTPAGPG